MKRLVYGLDQAVMEWTHNVYGIPPLNCEKAVAIMDGDKIVGSILWQLYRGHEIEISYYGPNTMTLGIARECAKVAIDFFGVSRVTARTSRSNKTMTRGITGIGFKYEGIIHAGYGHEDAILYGLYGEKLARLAGRTLQ